MKERPWHRCFHLNFAKFLRTLFLQSTFWRQLIGFFINVRRWFSYDISNSRNNFPESQKNHLAFMCMAILRWAAPWLQFTFLGSCVCIGSRKIPPGKFPPGKFPPIKLPPRKISPRKILTQKISTWNIPTYFIICLSSLNSTSIDRRRVYMYILLGRNILISPGQLRVFSWNFYNINNIFRKTFFQPQV